jgi:hypothetical protein
VPATKEKHLCRHSFLGYIHWQFRLGTACDPFLTVRYRASILQKAKWRINGCHKL